MSKQARPREARHVRLYHWVMGTAAWRDLDCVARSAYVELASRYSETDDKGFSNNGRIPMSLLELATALRVSKQTAMRALDALGEHGFIAVEAKGKFTTGYRRASEWRLTEFPHNGVAATKDFATWSNSKAGSTTKPDRVSTRNQSGVETEQVPEGNWPYGSTTTPEAQSSGSTTKPLVVYQGKSASTPTERAEPPAQRASQSAVASRGRAQPALDRPASRRRSLTDPRADNSPRTTPASGVGGIEPDATPLGDALAVLVARATSKPPGAA